MDLDVIENGDVSWPQYHKTHCIWSDIMSNHWSYRIIINIVKYFEMSKLKYAEKFLGEIRIYGANVFVICMHSKAIDGDLN